MTIRAAVLFDEKGVKLGRVMVPETVFVISHAGDTYVRTGEAIRLVKNGVGLGAVFRATEVYVREKLGPA